MRYTKAFCASIKIDLYGQCKICRSIRSKAASIFRNAKYIYFWSEWVASAVEESQKTPRHFLRQRWLWKLPDQSSQQRCLQERQYIPAEDMGDYEEYKKKKGPKKSGPLYPLNEEVVPPLA